MLSLHPPPTIRSCFTQLCCTGKGGHNHERKCRILCISPPLCFALRLWLQKGRGGIFVGHYGTCYYSLHCGLLTSGDAVGTRWPVLALFPGLSSLAVCKSRGGWPGPFYHMKDVSVYLGRQRGGRGGVPDRKNKLEAFSCSFCPKHLSFERSQSKKRTTLGSRQRLCARNVYFHSGTPPPLST